MYVSKSRWRSACCRCFLCRVFMWSSPALTENLRIEVIIKVWLLKWVICSLFGVECWKWLVGSLQFSRQRWLNSYHLCWGILLLSFCSFVLEIVVFLYCRFELIQSWMIVHWTHLLYITQSCLLHKKGHRKYTNCDTLNMCPMCPFRYNSPTTWNFIPTSVKNCLFLYGSKHHLIKFHLVAQLTINMPILATLWLPVPSVQACLTLSVL